MGRAILGGGVKRQEVLRQQGLLAGHRRVAIEGQIESKRSKNDR